MKKTLKNNPPSDTVVHTPTEEEAKELLAILHENGYRWYSGDNLNTYSNWVINKDSTCYRLGLGGVSYYRKEYYIYEDFTILTLAEFKSTYCEDEKPQPKFKVGDIVLYKGKRKVVHSVNTTLSEPIYTLTTLDYQSPIQIEEHNITPYTEPETKPTEDMEAKEKEQSETGNNSENSLLNLCELLAWHVDETFYSPCFGELTLLETDCDSLLFITARGIRERFNLDGRLWTAVSTAVPILFPSRELYEQYPLDPCTAWMKWREEQRAKQPSNILVYVYTDTGDCLENEDIILDESLKFNTPADRDKFIEEINAVIEKHINN